MTYGYYDEADVAYGYYSSENQHHFHSTALRGEGNMKHAYYSSERQDGVHSSAQSHEKDMLPAVASKANAIGGRAMEHSENEFKEKTGFENESKQPLVDYGSNALNVAKGKMMQMDAERVKSVGQALERFSDFKEQQPEAAQNKVGVAMISRTTKRSTIPIVMI